MLEEPLRVAVSGVGDHARLRLIPAIQASPGLQLAAFATREAGKAAELRRLHPQARIFSSHFDSEFYKFADLVVACGPPELNTCVATIALNSGVNVFCEKPLATNRCDATKLLAIAQNSSSITAVGLNLKYSSTVTDLISLTREDPAVTIHVEYSTPKPRAPAWGEPNVAAACALWHAVHVLDLIEMFIGPGRLAEVNLPSLEAPYIAICAQIEAKNAQGSFMIRNSAPSFALVIRILLRSGTQATLTDLRELTLSGPEAQRKTSTLYRLPAAEYSVSPLADDVDCSGYRTMFTGIATAITTGAQPSSSFQNVAGVHFLLYDLIDEIFEEQ